MPTYYDVTLGGNIPHGSDILNKPCTVVFSYPNGAHSHTYTAQVLAWLAANTVRIVSPYMNIEAAWVGANGGTLSINTGNGVLQFPIIGFVNVGHGRLLQATFKGDADTELDQVISDQPWLDAFKFGVGIDAVTGSASGTAVKPFTPIPRKVKRSTEHYRFIQSESELKREIEVSASGKYNIEGVTVEASTSYLSKLEYSELAITLVASYESEYDGYDEADSYELTEEAKELAADPARFRKAYGDYFVAGARRGSRFLATYVCKTTTVKSMDEFKASLGVEAPDVFSAEGSAKFMQAASNSNVSISMDLFMDGYSGTPPSGPWTPEKILQALEWFKANEHGVALRAKLDHYSTIDPSYPRTVDVPPDAFVDLRTLYSDVWTIRSEYASCPRHYQDQLKKEYQTLDYGVVANQAVLVSDSNKRQDYQAKADALSAKLNDVFSRMDFYFKVKSAVSSEPAKDQRIDETSGGQQTWLYGFSTYPKSTAVVIHSQTQNYHDSWHVGWREKTLGFGPDGNSLIVGWQVIANWQDGTDGGWWKAKDQILLTDQSAVHVKSLYDRGCDWSVAVYYVDAKDYQF